MSIVVPVRYEESSEDRNVMTAAISSVVAVRPRGMSRASAASCSGVLPTRMLVSTAPGVTALTVTPLSASSRASALVSPRIAA